MSIALLRLRPLSASLLLAGLALVLPFLAGIAALLLIPLLLVAGMLLGWVVSSLLLGWAGIEGLAALERWLEQDFRFRR